MDADDSVPPDATSKGNKEGSSDADDSVITDPPSDSDKDGGSSNAEDAVHPDVPSDGDRDSCMAGKGTSSNEPRLTSTVPKTILAPGGLQPLKRWQT